MIGWPTISFYVEANTYRLVPNSKRNFATYVCSVSAFFYFDLSKQAQKEDIVPSTTHMDLKGENK